MLGSLLSVEIALLSLIVILEEGIFALARVAETLSQICSASEEFSLLLFIADSVAVMRSTIDSCRGKIAKFRPFAISFWFHEGPVGLVLHVFVMEVCECGFIVFSS